MDEFVNKLEIYKYKAISKKKKKKKKWWYDIYAETSYYRGNFISHASVNVCIYIYGPVGIGVLLRYLM